MSKEDRVPLGKPFEDKVPLGTPIVNWVGLNKDGRVDMVAHGSDYQPTDGELKVSEDYSKDSKGNGRKDKNMKYRLIDVIRKIEEDVQFGTCDLCQHMGTLYYDVLVFEDEDGNRFKEENGGWDWGDYFEYWDIDNYVDFAGFIADKGYPEPERDEYGVGQFHEIVSMMYQDYSEYEDEEGLDELG